MKTLLLPLCVVALIGCKRSDPAQAPPAAPPAAPPEARAVGDAQPQVAKAREVFAKVGAALSERLGAAVQEGGVPKAIEVCKAEAATLTARAIEGTGIRAGRTSHKLRSQANAPAEWMRPIVAEGAGRKAGDVGVRTVDLGDRVGVMAPIPTGGLCVACHGDDQAVSVETRAALAAAYPADEARGFGEGDLRGWFWAEVPK